MAKRQKAFRVGAFVKAWVEIEIAADSLEAAVQASRSLKTIDFVGTDGEFCDLSHEVIGVTVADFPSVN